MADCIIVFKLLCFCSPRFFKLKQGEQRFQTYLLMRSEVVWMAGMNVAAVMLFKVKHSCVDVTSVRQPCDGLGASPGCNWSNASIHINGWMDEIIS